MLVETINKMIAALEAVKPEAEKLEVKKVNAAGTKVNKAMGEIVAMAKANKKEVSEIRNEIKANKSK